MAGIRLLDVHRTWEDYVGIALGVAIGLSPWLAGEDNRQAVNFNAAAVGLLVLALAMFELVDLHRWEETGEIALGLWLIASPFVFGYADTGTLMLWHFALGAIVVLLAVLELWQDWRLSDKDLAHHGW
jgi:hypothetical protein